MGVAVVMKEQVDERKEYGCCVDCVGADGLCESPQQGGEDIRATKKEDRQEAATTPGQG